MHPLDPDSPLPDHICTFTMLASVYQWVADEWMVMPSTLKRPLLHDKRSLMMVVRQWVYEPTKDDPGKDWLRGLLDRKTLWPYLIDVVRKSRQTAELRERIIAAIAVQDGVTRAEAEREMERFMRVRGHDLWHLQEIVYDAALGDEYMLGFLLRKFRLPDTPVQRAYFRARVAGANAAETELWQSVADRWRLEVDDAVHLTWLFGLKHLLKRAGDEIGSHVAEACERELKRRLGTGAEAG